MKAGGTRPRGNLRIVVPKPIRDRLGFRAGMDLEVTEAPDALIIKSRPTAPAMVKVNGFLVHQGVAAKGFDWNRHIDEDREERHRMMYGV